MAESLLQKVYDLAFVISKKILHVLLHTNFKEILSLNLKTNFVAGVKINISRLSFEDVE